MKKIICKQLIVFSLLFVSFTHAQKRLVVMGSSSALGTGASDTPLSWAGLLNSYFHQNTTDGLDTLYFNIAHSAYTTYEEMPTSFVPPAGRPLPDPNCNVTKALSLNPDVVIINLPTNDAYYYFSKKEYMDNLRLMYSVITSSGAQCYISTTQPRNFTDAARRDTLRTLVDSINNNFGLYSIDFWTDLVSNDGLNYMKPEINYGDGIHVNDLGHYYLFLRVRNKNIFQPLNIPLPVAFKSFTASAQNTSILLKWSCEDEGPGTAYELQRSNNSNQFQKIASITSNFSGSYSYTDDQPFTGKNYYRIKISEPGHESYSKTISVEIKGTDVYKIYFSGVAQSLLTAEISSSRNTNVMVQIINSEGMLIRRQYLYLIKSTQNKITFSMGSEPAGIYFFTIRDEKGTLVSKQFFK
ncbi:MAG: SGNH/GDSL hydrolase family protein [Bacteroidetes bacterium]|nr:SGNH/GDSL hydrolase family protein [Bacteroidota bacterium]